MKTLVSVLGWLLLLFGVMACVDQLDLSLRGTVDVVVVDGTINNLPETQTIRLNRSRADPLTGRFGFRPLTKASVAIVVDSALVVPCPETVDGTYQPPSDFRGQVGHAYQLRFTLSDGTRYQSSQQVMAASPPIDAVSSQFNPNAIFPPLGGYYTAGHDLFVSFTDPPQTRNYYRWNWKLYEKQAWCRSCYQGEYSIYNVTAMLMEAPPPIGKYWVYTSDNTTLLEDCYFQKSPPLVADYRYDYRCRTQCWEIIYNYDINVFDDQLTNGGLIAHKVVAHIPFYDHNPGLVEIRQSALTVDAYRYFKQVQAQTQNTGGLADTPPAAPIGNVHNLADSREKVVGYFTAGGVTLSRYWLDRKDVSGVSLGGSGPDGYSGLPGGELFYALNLRQPSPEPTPPNGTQFTIFNSPPRPPTALCVPSDNRMPVKPEGWRD